MMRWSSTAATAVYDRGGFKLNLTVGVALAGDGFYWCVANQSGWILKDSTAKTFGAAKAAATRVAKSIPRDLL